MSTFFLVIIYITFISLGLPDSLLGSSWPIMHTDLGVGLSSAGIISFIITGGTIISSLLSDKVIKRFGTGNVTFVSVTMTAFALLGFAFAPSFIWLCMLAIPLGLGAGAVDSSLNNYVALHYKAQHMSWLHCFWGVGATSGPIIMSLFIAKNNEWSKGYLAVAIIQFVVVLLLLVTLPMWKKVKSKNSSDNNSENIVDITIENTVQSNIESNIEGSVKSNVENIEEVKDEDKGSLLKLPGIKFVLVSFFCYCATESMVGLWGSSYLVNNKGVSPDIAARWLALYFGGITIGRLISGFVAMKLKSNILIRIGQTICIVGAVILILPLPVYFSMIGLILIGLGCAPIYPSMLHDTPNRFGESVSQSLMGVQMACAYVGSTVMPPLLGLVSSKLGMSIFPIFLLTTMITMFICSERINIFMKSRKDMDKKIEKIDLHMHSCFSDDGEFSVEEIIDMAISRDIGVISITDHNSVKGVEPALLHAKDKNIKVIPGIEIDCSFNDLNLHVLGYNIDYKNECFNEVEENILRQEKVAANEKIDKIVEFTGLKLDKSEVLKRAHNGIVTGELIAEMLLEDEENRKSEILKPYMEGGSKSDMPYVNFYWDYFSKGKSAYVEMEFPSLKETVNMIHNNGGFAVIAHPGNNLKDDLTVIDELIKVGIDGIEVFSTYHKVAQTEYFYNKAIENNLKITCGSDFHGKNKPNIKLGNFEDYLGLGNNINKFNILTDLI